MNYEIEENFDWKMELNKEDTNLDVSFCLISGEPLIDGNITLPCNHSFNYYFLYLEVIKQKNNKFESKKLTYKQIKCPYCREIHNNLLPFYNLPNIKKIYGINSPESLTFKFNKCDYIYKSGKKQGCLCNNNNAMNTKLGNFCKNHYKLQCIEIYKNNIKNPLEKLKVPELKLILKKNKCKVGGKKEDLIKRIELMKKDRGESWID